VERRDKPPAPGRDLFAPRAFPPKTMMAPAASVQASETSERLRMEAAQIAAAKADPRRFADLYQSHFERVYAYVARRVRDRAEAEDLTSDVFQRALASLSRFEPRGAPFLAWLLSIAGNAILDRARRAAHARDALPFDPPPPVELADAEQRGRLFRLVDRLSADQRRVVVMRFGEQQSIREVAQALARSEGAVKQLQLRALQRLRKLWDETDA
jgi:RNA polymerase sigma-70 factor (ECF subfamily)